MKGTTTTPEVEAPTEATFKFKRLPDNAALGDWGVAAWNPSPTPEEGDEVQVAKRNGSFQTVTLGPLVTINRYKGGTSYVFALTEQMERRAKAKATAAEVQPGVYEKDGDIYVVVFNQAKTAVYAKKLVVLGSAAGDRLNEADQDVRFSYEYERGAVYKLTAKDRLDPERAKELCLRYGRCIRCGRELEVKESVEAGVGPVCRRAMGWSE